MHMDNCAACMVGCERESNCTELGHAAFES